MNVVAVALGLALIALAALTADRLTSSRMPSWVAMVLFGTAGLLLVLAGLTTVEWG